MIPVYTQKNLDKSSWPEIQRLHKSLGLKATAGARTRRHLQQNIIAATSQPAEPEAIASGATPLTCSTCPLAQLIEDNRYCCGLTDAAVRGHWEAKSDDCYKAVADTCEVEVPETTTEVEALTPVEIAEPEPVISLAEKLTGLTRHPFRYRHDIHQGGHSFTSAMYGMCECNRCNEKRKVTTPIAPELTTTDDAPSNRGDSGHIEPATIAQTPANVEESIMAAMTKESDFDKKQNDLAYLSELQMNAQIAVEKSIIGSEDEAIALLYLKRIERDIEFYGRTAPELTASPAIQQLQNQMDEPKQDIARKSTLSLFKIEAFDPSILPIEPEPEQLSEEIEVKPEGTIHWTQALLTGVITGKKGAKRTFYIRNGEIFIMLSPDFTAGESEHPNVRHTQIRDAINAGRDFDPKAFKDSPQFLTDTKNYGGIGRIMQGADGRWWAWSQTGVTGHSFLCQGLACKYLDRVATQAQKQLVCAS